MTNLVSSCEGPLGLPARLCQTIGACLTQQTFVQGLGPGAA